ncbi:MAG: hypothetical protein V3S01_12565 [Dehalococcoidia bacterium]
MCYDVWADVAARTPRAKIAAVPNPDEASHYVMLDRMWDLAIADGARYIILTEADFLPDLTVDWIQAAIDLLGDKAALTPRHVEWMGTSWEPVQADSGCGASFQLYDTTRLPEGFRPPWVHGTEDPISTLHLEIPTERVYGRDVHFSMRYAFGCHLFWSRVYNKAPFVESGGKMQISFHHTYPLYCLQAAVVAMLRRWKEVLRV